MKILVGLGNPTKQYDNTRHNIGFDVIDFIAKENHISMLEKKHKAFIGKGIINGEKVILAKPQTYMNLSGESVREIVDYYKVSFETELFILYDDISLDVGQIRIRKKGSAGGHNGIKSIINHLGSEAFCRIKIGVGDKPKYIDLADYVLGHFTKKEREIMLECSKDIEKAVELLVHGEIDQAMNLYNKKIRME
ncbi:MAG: aminoacyl-tRNA hydrolase [Lachnospiraceae bacterium]